MAEDEMILDDEEGEGEGTEERPRRKLGGLLVKILTFLAFGIVGIIIMVLVAIFVNKQMSTTTTSDVEVRSFDPGFRPRTDPLATRKLKSFRVNLDAVDETNAQVFVQCEISLAFDDTTNKELTTELTSRDDQIRSRINSLISSKTVDEINTSFKRENYLAREILNEINSLLTKGQIKEVYITQFTIARPQS